MAYCEIRLLLVQSHLCYFYEPQVVNIPGPAGITTPSYDIGKKTFPATSSSWNTSKDIQMFGLTCSAEARDGKGSKHQLEGSDHHIYVASWCLNEINGLQLILKAHIPLSAYCQKCVADTFFAYHSTSTIPIEKNCDHLKIAIDQSTICFQKSRLFRLKNQARDVT